jgi:hypothetical protein
MASGGRQRRSQPSHWARLVWTSLTTVAALALFASASQARVTRIVIDERVPLQGPGPAYEQIAGRAFGELDPAAPGNAIIQDIGLAKEADGKARYVASFVITRPMDAQAGSGLMWHDVPNRGRPAAIAPQERAAGDVHLASAWQGDNAGATAVRATMSAAGNHWLQLPVARGEKGERITGLVFGRIVNRSGPASQPLLVQTNPVPYKPLSLDTRQATLVSRGGEQQDGSVMDERPCHRTRGPGPAATRPTPSRARLTRPRSA